jgi:hypothetical protein
MHVAMRAAVTRTLLIALVLLTLTPPAAFAQKKKGDDKPRYGSPYRAEYEKEPNGPHGECTDKWQRVASGVDYRAITCLGDEDDIDVHAFKISREFFNIDVAYAPGGGSTAHMRHRC